MRWVEFAAATAVLVAGPVSAQPLSPTSEGTPRLSAGQAVRPVALTRLGSQVRDDQVIGRYLTGVVCVNAERLLWKDVAGGFVNLKEVFGEELKAAGFRPDSEPGDLFADTKNANTDLQVGAMVRSVDATYCDTDLGALTGSMTLTVQWQIYSTLRREVVATIETTGAVKNAKLARKQQVRSLGQLAFAETVKSLLSDAHFRQLVTSPDPGGSSVVGSMAPRTPIRLVGPRGGAPVNMAQASGSVVAIFAGSGHGSGALISSEGYILTNEHVVGTATTVRVRWSDGFETTGTVERTDKRRDVALVKTSPRGREPLAVSRTVPSLGAPVFAIGTPLEPNLQNTVTRGVVSATRIIDGFNFIQSDTPVTHGNSGGPLLDEKGVVVGITHSIIDPTKGSALNFFIPVGDALDFLALETPAA